MSSGVGVSVKELAVQVLAATGVKAPLTTDPALARAVDVPALVGSNARLRDATGWEPEKTRARPDRGPRDVLGGAPHGPGVTSPRRMPVTAPVDPSNATSH